MAIQDRARTKPQKAEIIGRLMTLWSENPDMRLTQLIENARGGDKGTLSADSGIFYNTEDFVFIRELEKFYARQ